MNKFLKIDEYFLFRYIWLIVILPKELQTVILTTILIILLTKKKIQGLDVIFYLILLYGVVHIFSIFTNIHFDQFELSRIFAAINTAMIWIIAILFYINYRNVALDIYSLEKSGYINMVILIGLSLISIVLFNIFKIKSINILGAPLYGVEWFNNKFTLRFGALLEYANLIIFFYLMFFPLYLSYLIKNKSNLMILFYILLSYIPIIISLSRSGYLSVIFFMIIILGYMIIRCCDKRIILAISVFTLAFIIICLAYYEMIPKLIQIIDGLINGRIGSNNTRLYLYRESILSTKLYSPLFGRGIKIISLTGYPLGSHSTYIGFYYKTGIIGLTLGLSAFIFINIKLILVKINQYSHFLMKVSLLIISLMLIVEDLDGESWLVVYYFCLVGITFNVDNWNRISLNNENRGNYE